MIYAAPGARWVLVASMFIQGDPAGQPRVKFDTRGKFPRAYTPTDGNTGSWKELLFWQARRLAPSKPCQGPVRVTITAFFDRPGSLKKRCYPVHPFEMIQKPDEDNIRKMVLDVLTSLDFYVDDKQVCGGATQKYYVSNGPAYQGPGTKPGAYITVEYNSAWPYKSTPSRKT